MITTARPEIADEPRRPVPARAAAAPGPTLSVLDAVAIIVGVVLGAGIFRTPALVAALVTGGCATTGRHEAPRTEDRLVAAGFRPQPADMAEEQAELKAMLPLTVVLGPLAVAVNGAGQDRQQPARAFYHVRVTRGQPYSQRSAGRPPAALRRHTDCLRPMGWLPARTE